MAPALANVACDKYLLCAYVVYDAGRGNFYPGNTAEYVLDRFVSFDDSCLYYSGSCEENKMGEGVKRWFAIVAYLFVAIASIIAIFRPEGMIWIVVFVLSAVVSLILAITRMLNNKKMADRIRYLEKHHLSIETDDENEGLIIKEGRNNAGR